MYKSGEWSGWRTKPFEIVIDMEEAGAYSSVTLGTLVVKASYILAPLYVSVATSVDGVNFEEVARKDIEPVEGGVDDSTLDVELSFPETSARYLKVCAGAVPQLPDWHFAPGKPGNLFIDEVIVR